MAKYIRKSVGILSKRTLSEFGELVNKIANLKDKSYSSVVVDQTIDHGVVFKTEFKAYVSGYTWVTADSVEECVQKVERMCLGSKNEINQEITF